MMFWTLAVINVVSVQRLTTTDRTRPDNNKESARHEFPGDTLDNKHTDNSAEDNRPDIGEGLDTQHHL